MYLIETSFALRAFGTHAMVTLFACRAKTWQIIDSSNMFKKTVDCVFQVFRNVKQMGLFVLAIVGVNGFFSIVPIKKSTLPFMTPPLIYMMGFSLFLSLFFFIWLNTWWAATNHFQRQKILCKFSLHHCP